MGQSEVVRDVDVEEVVELGFWEECVEWQDGVLRAERPAERAMCRRGTGGRESSVLWVCRNNVESVIHRDGLYSSWRR